MRRSKLALPCDHGSISVSHAPVCIAAAKRGHLLAIDDDFGATATVAAVAASDVVDAAVRISSLMASLIVFIVAIAFVEWQM